MAVLLTGTTIAGNIALHAGNVSTYALPIGGGTLTGQLNLHAGSYEGSIVFGSQAVWRTGIRQHDDGDAELRIWAKNANGMIFIATGYDGEPASISRPTDGLAIQGNKLGIGDFSTADPSYKLHVKGDIYANGGWLRVSGSEGLYFESHGGGWRMIDSTWIRAYNDKNIYTAGTIQAARFEDANDSGYYLDPASSSNLNGITARQYYQALHGEPRNNLGDPTITDMALFDAQFNNKTEGYPASKVRFFTSSDGTNFTEYTGFNDVQKQRLLSGDDNSGVYIPNLTNRFRVELDARGYVFVSMMYLYWSSNSHSTKIHIWIRRCDNQQWYQHTSSNTDVSSWPGHVTLPFGSVAWLENNTTSSGHFDKIRIEFIPTWSGHPTYGGNAISLDRLQLWGGYPAGKRNLYYTNYLLEATFPSNVYSSSGKLATESYVTSQGYITSSGSISGNAATATTLATARTLTIGATGKTFNGSADVSWTLAEIGAQAAGSYAAASHTHGASSITSGTFGAGHYIFPYQSGITGASAPSYTQGSIEIYTDSNHVPAIGFHRGGYSATTLYEYDGQLYVNAWVARAQTGLLLSTGNIGSYAAAVSHTHTPSEVGLGNVSNAAQVTTTNNSSLNTDSRNTRGVTRLYRNDSDSDYSVQVYWTGSHWFLRGYNGDTFHAEARVGYADSAGAVAWTNVSGRPTALSSFTNDLGNYGGFLTAETNTFLGDGGAANTHPGTSRLIFTGQVSSGTDVLGMPATDNSNAFLNINRHPGEYNSQLGFSSNGSMYYRSFSAAAINSTQAWRQVWDSGNLTNLNQLTNGPGYITGNQTITLSGDVSGSGTTSISVTVNNIDGWGFVNTGSNSATNADSINSNGISYYTGGVTNFSGNATDGALYSQRYSDAWQHQIAGDYRSGQIALRGKNNGTWQAWRTVLDSSNFSTWAAAASHTHSYLPLSGGDLTGSIGVPSGSSVFLATSGDSNWRIGRNLVTESDNSLTGSTMQFIAANATDQGWQFVNSAGKTIVEISAYTNGGLFVINQKEFWLKQPISGRLTTIRKKSTDTLSPNPVKIADTSLAAYSANGNPNTYIIIQTTVPQDEYQMGGFTIDLFGRYGDTNAKTKIDLGGYWNPEGNSGFQGWEAHGTNPQVKPTIQVARNTNSGMTAIIISGITWDYPVVVARDLYLGYNSADGGGYGFGWHIYSSPNINDFSNLDTVVWRNAYSDSNPAGYITGYTETDTLATVTARGNTTTGTINVNGNILLTGTATTTNQARTIDFTGFDKEGTTDFSDRAYIQHTVNTGGHAGSVLVISSENDADDGIAFLTNASSKLKHNSNNIATETWVTSQGYITSSGSISGNAATATIASTVTVNSGNTSAAWYPIVWHSGNTVYSSSGVEIYAAGNYIRCQYINTTDNDESGITRFVIKNGDSYHRSATTTVAADIIRGVASGTWSINVTGSAGSATTATTANRLERYGIIYGDNWNTYYQNNRLVAISAHNHTGSNRPTTAYTYGSGLSYYNSGSDHYQFFFPENGGSSNANNYKIHYRSGWNDSWGGWRTLIDLYNSVCYVDGAITATGDITAYSDARIKENVNTLESALDKTLSLRGVSYNRTDIEDKSTKIGFIAQELLEVIPEVVTEDENGMYGVSYGNITALLVEAIKEQQKQIEELKLEIQKLKSI